MFWPLGEIVLMDALLASIAGSARIPGGNQYISYPVRMRLLTPKHSCGELVLSSGVYREFPERRDVAACCGPVIRLRAVR